MRGRGAQHRGREERERRGFSSRACIQNSRVDPSHGCVHGRAARGKMGRIHANAMHGRGWSLATGIGGGAGQRTRCCSLLKLLLSPLRADPLSTLCPSKPTGTSSCPRRSPTTCRRTGCWTRCVCRACVQDEQRGVDLLCCWCCTLASRRTCNSFCRHLPATKRLPPLPCPTAKQHTERVEGSRRAAVARLGALCDPPSGAAHHAVQVRCCTLRAPRALRRVRRMRARSALMLPLACCMRNVAFLSRLQRSAATHQPSVRCTLCQKNVASPPNAPRTNPKTQTTRRPKGYGQPQAMNVQQAHQPLMAQQ